jgi:hypothetical protein
MSFNKKLHDFQNRVFDIVIYITYFLYILIALGLSANAPDLLDELQLFMKIYISLFLMYRFIPFRHVQFTDLDAKIAFNAGWFLFISTIFNSVLVSYIDSIRERLGFFKFVK